jgi:hypothetical protein
LYFAYRDKVVGVFVRFRAALLTEAWTAPISSPKVTLFG